ncbi:MAG: hypothetical protein ACYCPW_08375 [Nitrososphaerales archaeon]
MPTVPSLDFFWDRYFVKGESGDCVPSCVSMAALYWKDKIPDLPIPADLEEWKRFVRRTSDVSYRGTSLRRLMRNMPSTIQESVLANAAVDPQAESVQLSEYPAEQEGPITLEPIEAQGLVMDPRQLKDSAELESFLLSNPAIPTILVLDMGIAQYNKKWGAHAVLLHSVDSTMERKIRFIDPDPAVENLREPFPMDLRRFEIGWKPYYNTVILIYPKGQDIRVISSERNYVKLTVFMEEQSTNCPRLRLPSLIRWRLR